MKDVKKDFQVMTREFKALAKKVGQLTTKLTKTAVHELEHVQTAVKLKSPKKHAVDAVKALTRQTDKLIKAVGKFEKKAAKKQQAKARPAKKASAKKTFIKKPPTKRGKTLTATDHVLRIMKRSKKGVDVPALMKKTGFGETKVRNILNRTLKQGKIKRVRRGVYVAA